ncbi:MAG: peptidase dimerization domain-containing protein, partial [Candidatus Heimdallarchaeota archaeon]|nr:peptidase dimerization domain-containing protein [Candidatus Heimdallarchaeota archaeon]
SLSLHGIQGAFSTPGTKTVIPAKVVGKVSMRLVPDQDPDEIAKQFADFVINLFAKLDSPNTLNVLTLGTGHWWFGDPNNSLYTTAQKVLKEHWGIDPILTRSGGSIPIVPFMEECLSANAIGFPIGQFSDGAHSQNERIRLKNLIGGREVLKKFFIEIASDN